MSDRNYTLFRWTLTGPAIWAGAAAVTIADLPYGARAVWITVGVGAVALAIAGRRSPSCGTAQQDQVTRGSPDSRRLLGWRAHSHWYRVPAPGRCLRSDSGLSFPLSGRLCLTLQGHLSGELGDG